MAISAPELPAPTTSTGPWSAPGRLYSEEWTCDHLLDAAAELDRQPEVLRVGLEAPEPG